VGVVKRAVLLFGLFTASVWAALNKGTAVKDGAPAA